MLICYLNTRNSKEMFSFQLLTKFDGYMLLCLESEIASCVIVSTDNGCSSKHDMNVAE